MKRFLAAALVSVFAVACGTVRADEQDARAAIDKAIKAMGGEAKLGKSSAHKVTTKGKITFNDNENPYTSRVTIQGLTRFRSEFEGEFNGNQVKGVTVLNGDNGWRKFGDNFVEMDAAAVANEKRNVYLQAIPGTLVPLKGKDFKVESAAEEKIADKPAVVIKVTGPDGKDFSLAFDKESGLPVRVVATVVGFNGQEFTQETNLHDYKDFGGIKKPTKIDIKRNGQKFIEQEITDFELLDKVSPDTFSEPK